MAAFEDGTGAGSGRAALGALVVLALAAGCGKEFTSGAGGDGGSGGSTTSSTTSGAGTSSTTSNSSGGSGGQGQAGQSPGGFGGGGGGFVPPPCDPGWDFYPDPPVVGADFHVVYYTAQSGSWVWVEFSVSGNGSPQVTAPDVIGHNPPYVDYFAWRSTVSGHQPGQLDLAFWQDCDATCTFVSACSIVIEPAAY